MEVSNVIEIDFSQKLEIKISNQKPVILTDLTMSLLGINQQYQRFISNRGQTPFNLTPPISAENNLVNLKGKESLMPRRARLLLPGVALHLIQRGNNRSPCFFAEEDYLFYLEHLADQAKKHDCAIHAWCLMTNHVHLLLTPAKPENASLLMKGLGQRYVQYVNRTYRRSGTLWEGRFRSCMAQEEHYVLACYRYIEMNPVRAAIVKHPAEYRWSSYRANAQGEHSALVRRHLLYQALGDTEEARALAYRALFRHQLESGLIDQIRSATNGNYALGSSRFAAEVESVLGQRGARGQPGRPRKNPTVD